MYVFLPISITHEDIQMPKKILRLFQKSSRPTTTTQPGPTKSMQNFIKIQYFPQNLREWLQQWLQIKQSPPQDFNVENVQNHSIYWIYWIHGEDKKLGCEVIWGILSKSKRKSKNLNLSQSLCCLSLINLLQNFSR